MDFLDQVILDNTIKSYCIVGGTILLILFLKRYFSRYIAAVLFRLFHRIWKNVAKQNFIDLVVEPLEWFLLIIIAVFAIDKLNFPVAWQYKIYGHAIDDILTRLGIGIIIVSFTWFMLRVIDFIALVLEHNAAITADKTDDQLVIFFRDFLKVVIGIIGLLMLIKACFNQPIGNLLTSLSIVGAAVALAAKESLENLIASFIIFFDKPFTAGDTLKANNVTGTVEKIGLRSTRIRTGDKTLVTVPNKLMVDSVVDNWSMRTHRRAEIKLELASNTPSALLQTIIKTIKEKLAADTSSITSYSVHLTDVNKTGNTIKAEYFTHPVTMDDFTVLKEEYYFFIKHMLEENKVAMSTTSAIDDLLARPATTSE
ncbi:mechanosensitive ion channel family protein [Ferruginibacter profundus]